MKSAGTHPDLWYASINGVSGFVNSKFLRESKIYVKNPIILPVQIKKKESVQPEKVQQPHEVIEGTTILLPTLDNTNSDTNQISTEAPLLNENVIHTPVLENVGQESVQKLVENEILEDNKETENLEDDSENNAIEKSSDSLDTTLQIENNEESQNNIDSNIESIKPIIEISETSKDNEAEANLNIETKVTEIPIIETSSESTTTQDNLLSDIPIDKIKENLNHIDLNLKTDPVPILQPEMPVIPQDILSTDSDTSIFSSIPNDKTELIVDNLEDTNPSKNQEQNITISNSNIHDNTHDSDSSHIDNTPIPENYDNGISDFKHDNLQNEQDTKETTQIPNYSSTESYLTLEQDKPVDNHLQNQIDKEEFTEQPIITSTESSSSIEETNETDNVQAINNDESLPVKPDNAENAEEINESTPVPNYPSTVLNPTLEQVKPIDNHLQNQIDKKELMEESILTSTETYSTTEETNQIINNVNSINNDKSLPVIDAILPQTYDPQPETMQSLETSTSQYEYSSESTTIAPVSIFNDEEEQKEGFFANLYSTVADIWPSTTESPLKDLPDEPIYNSPIEVLDEKVNEENVHTVEENSFSFIDFVVSSYKSVLGNRDVNMLFTTTGKLYYFL